LQLQLLEVKSPDEFESVFDTAKEQLADAFVQITAMVFEPHQQRIVNLAAKHRLPVMYNRREDVETGGLCRTGRTARTLNRRVAAILDKILKGVKPAELPVEQPTKFEFN
jgi:putative ABC transport system substrate-binding protein